ncbi:hypothetical protein M0Q28_01385 [Patescibacteria group bacterium]|jgi:hypothetical protein|nr:hypothetical protein [Patescibacteria group bacterium]
MFLTTHAAIGALIAQQIPGQHLVAFTLGVASHFLSDIIPHGDTKQYKDYVSGRGVKKALAYVIIDAAVAIYFILFLFNADLATNRLTVSLGIAGGILPDLLVAVYEVWRVRGLGWFHRLHFFFHNLISEKKDMTLASGFAMQVMFLAALLNLIV